MNNTAPHILMAGVYPNPLERYRAERDPDLRIRLMDVLEGVTGLYCWWCLDTLHGVRSDARFCSTNCRVACHRAHKENQRRIAERNAREEALRAAKQEHQARWVSFLLEHGPTSSRLTKASAEHLYEAMLEHDMIERPFPQPRLFQPPHTHRLNR